MERSQSLGTMRGTWSLESGPRAVCLRVDLSICRVSDALQRRQRTDAPT